MLFSFFPTITQDRPHLTFFPVPSTLCAFRVRFSCLVLSSRVHKSTSLIAVSPPYLVFSFAPLCDFPKPRSLPLCTVWWNPDSGNIVFVTVVYLLQAKGIDTLHFSVFIVDTCARFSFKTSNILNIINTSPGLSFS